MKRIGAALLILLLVGAPALADQPTAAGNEDQALDRAFDRLIDALKQSKEFVERHPFYADKENRASGMAFISSMLIRTLEEDVVLDPDFPFFRILDFRIREGGDNPDQRYLFARIRGGETYRVWGQLGKQRRLDFQIYAGDPYVKGGGRVVSNLSMEQVKFGPDGSFEVFLSAKPMPGNWMENAPDSTKLMVRQIFSDWKNETPGEVHIDRVGYEGKLKPRATEAGMAAKLDQAAADILMIVKVWPDFVLHRYMEAIPPNTLPPPSDPSALGGVKGRWMTEGQFALKPDEALIVTTWPSSANYQGVQLADPWFSSLEYANRQTSLTADQAYLSKDGAFHFVIAGSDPGVQNWLDTTGLPRGVILLRYDGAKEAAFPKDKYPTTQKVKLSELRKYLPADTPSFTPEMRAEAIAIRRRHVQIRFGD
ncbi:MAG TPA: hypothetical protein VKZ79_23885 [Alphaproteobacteria bacterium]|nr:hypothetical protein [Alphaproteobacteria bacterium]